MAERTFRRYRPEEYIALLEQHRGKVRFSEVHVHHTYAPTIADYRRQPDKEHLIRGMWHYHTATRGWQDIAQHATVDPDGYVWDGRPLGKAPASATGYNDSDDDGVHPFMFEMIGNFDIGHETLEGAQLKAVLQLTAAVLDIWQLPLAKIRFHREMSAKTCPGSSIDKAGFVAQVETALQERRRKRGSGPTGHGDEPGGGGPGGASDETRSAEALPAVDGPVAIVLPERGLTLEGWLIGGTSYAPVRRLMAALGAEVRWDAERRAVTVVGKRVDGRE